ncbi:MazG nucleotide pyrophosphohydrolase domain protein [Acididesulfobacillus acetoxydans]|uniref:MazG nucleotide pyrophosphohydrolase domain protein n=1 Tax=Acididesulfobacillus acetoxydans TaxID=1561005 RepID=A0A8S0W6J5_9FIRM|nr:nucleoside triphosphate pyrophosphohydrolase [Acididesulfobacillus acetoxydans]CAA7599899.1 MazG nucleotide pyrophosphohydrolase domain protein [Acididesulfobacillus acetoxydans]CEJ08957.1 Nucleoside triphosphate pyrophosphohydrolase/pyrophosphatase MazG [Acididesulfobacillus acetoxydans]
MKARLHIIGLGPAGADKLTLESYRKLKQADRVFVRTERHPCVEELRREGVTFIPFDYIYGREKTFEGVYECIVARLREELSQRAEVVYAVPGHPKVAEKTVSLLQEELGQTVDIMVYPALSFLDEAYTALPLDPAEGLLVRECGGLKNAAPTGREWLVVPQVHSALVASDLKLDLMESYPDDAPVYVLRGLGSTAPQKIRVPLYELDRQAFDHLTAVAVPPQENVVSLLRLEEIMKRLRAADGCPWDKEQTHESLQSCLIEESYEVLDAIQAGDTYNLCEELGDLLLQVVFHAQIAAESDGFNLHDVMRMLIEKLIRRHPHVFGSDKVKTAEEVVRVWERVKETEKAAAGGGLGYFKARESLPALMQAAEVQGRAARAGFDWQDWQGPWGKVQEELAELKNALEQGDGIREELGDLFFALVNLSRLLGWEAEEVLRAAVAKFKGRFVRMLDLAEKDGRDWARLSLPEMDVYWEKAKSQEKSGKVVLA